MCNLNSGIFIYACMKCNLMHPNTYSEYNGVNAMLMCFTCMDMFVLVLNHLSALCRRAHHQDSQMQTQPDQMHHYVLVTHWFVILTVFQMLSDGESTDLCRGGARPDNQTCTLADFQTNEMSRSSTLKSSDYHKLLRPLLLFPSL